jgi:hypothetical protein
MNDFIPSEGFVNKTMEAVRTYEVSKARSSGIYMHGIVSVFLQTGALLAGCGIALVNVLRLYYAVFAPVISH